MGWHSDTFGEKASHPVLIASVSGQLPIRVNTMVEHHEKMAD
jgi:hypothetical protein